MLEGKELEGNIGNVGNYSLDVNDKGSVKIVAGVHKDFGGAVVSNDLSIEVSIFTLLEELVKKTNATWDDALISTLESALGIKKV